MRKMEIFIIGLVAIVGFSFLVEILISGPDLRAVAKGFIPSIPDNHALYIAIGIIGATVMPHNLYLHSALVQTRKIRKDDASIRKALRMSVLDSAIALNLAFFVNAAILVLAATVFFYSGRTDVARIEDAHALLSPMLGSSLASTLFAIALIAAGQSSTITGTLSGQIVMEGYLRLRINPWVRRLLTRLVAIVPALLVIYFYGDQEVDALLILSQVILSVQLGFAIIPLIHFVSDKDKMGPYAISQKTKIIAWIVASVLVYLNLRMIVGEISVFFAKPGLVGWKILMVLGAILYTGLLLYITVMPVFASRKNRGRPIDMHPETATGIFPEKHGFRKIAVALEFQESDQKLISHALHQGGKDSGYVLLHIVESPSTKLLGQQSDDYETRRDEEQLRKYKQDLEEKGYEVSIRLGFHQRSREIVRIVSEEQADLLVIGAHGHSGLKDFIYGETIDTVRHELKIPVLIISL
jgi:manganese transport protein